MAATEQGLLRQGSIVSDLREGFLSKLHNSTSTPGNSAEASSSLSDETNGEAESTCIGGPTTEIHTASVLEIDADENRSRHEFVSRVTEVEDFLYKDRFFFDFMNEIEISCLVIHFHFSV